MSAGDDLSATALAVAVVALVIALLQMAQQYFSTADGFRECRPDVIGGWSARNDSHFDGRNLRYETIFSTPHLWLARPADWKDGNLPVGHGDLPSTAGGRSDIASVRVSWLALLEHTRDYQRGLLEAFEHDAGASGSEGVDTAEKGQVQRGLDRGFESLQKAGGETGLTVPTARPTQISWDFMPPDVVKPFATIALHDLLILGHRLQLDWTEVKPMEGKLTAQDDDGNDISSYFVRGLGLMVQFRHDTGRSAEARWSRKPPGRSAKSEGGRTYAPEDLLVPSSHADKLAFGIIPGDPRLNLDDVVVATNEDCLNYVASLYDDAADQRKRNPRGALQRGFERGDITKTGIDQLMPLIAPCMVLPHCRTIGARRPNRYCHIGVLEVMEGYVVFRERVHRLARTGGGGDRKGDGDVNVLGPALQGALELIMRRWGEIRNEVGPWAPVNVRDLADRARLSTKMASVHGECTAWLESWGRRFLDRVDDARDLGRGRQGRHFARPRDRRPVHDLVRLHLARAFELREKAERRLRDHRGSVDTYGLSYDESPIFSAMMHVQIDEVDELAREVVTHVLGGEIAGRVQTAHAERFDDLTDSVASAWFVMIFRALVFNRSVTFVEPRRPGAGGRAYNLLPAQWLYSQLPIHIS